MFFLALERGSHFAAIAAAGCQAGAIGEGAFCLGYVWWARRFYWPQAFLAGAFCFALIAALLAGLHPSIVPLFLAAIGVAGGSLWLVPRGKNSRSAASQPRWDVPIRMMTATAAIIVLTATANLLGPTLSGILAAFPIYASTLTIFAHRSEGREAAVQVLRGLLYGLFSYGAFFLSLSLLILHTTLANTFIISAMIATAVQGGSLWTIRREISTYAER